MRRMVLVTAALLLAVPALMGAHMGVQQLIGNFHTVVEGEVYRSAQPGADDVEAYASQYGVRTILNLRDEVPDQEALDARAAAAAAGIEIIDFPLSSAQDVPVAEAERLAAIMRDAPKPLLIHCDHGSNRTSLASAIYVGAVEQGGELAAEFQISPYFGHVPIKGIGRYKMYRSWDAFEETIGF